MAEPIAVLMTEAFASPGGIQLVNRNLMKALAESQEWQADFFSLLDTGPEAAYVGDRPFLGCGGDRVRFLAAATRALLSRRYRLLIITHVHLAALALLWDALLRRPYAVMTHGIEVWGRLSPLKRRVLRRAPLLLANSRFTRERMCAAHGLREDRVSILPLCPDYSWAEPGGSRPAESGATLLTVGRALRGEGYKGHDLVIRALPRIVQACPQVRYVVVGAGDEEERLRAMARGLGVEDHVHLAGYQPPDRLRQHYRDCTLFLMPSRGEGFGLVYLEAMLYGKPCIASNCDAGQEIVRHGINGLTVDPGDPEALAAAVIGLLQDPGRRAEFGEAGYRILNSEYTFERFSAALTEALRQALGQKET